MQVLEGWLFLGNVQELGSRLANAFMAAVSTSSAQTVRSVLLTQPALAQRAMAGTTVQDLTRGIPSDIFRTCVARVSLWLGGSGLSSYIARLVKGTNASICTRRVLQAASVLFPGSKTCSGSISPDQR